MTEMAGMMSDPTVTAFYPRPKSVEKVPARINWDKMNYEERGYGL